MYANNHNILWFVHVFPCIDWAVLVGFAQDVGFGSTFDQYIVDRGKAV